MPLQNRVDPFGEFIRTPARGTLMGNRGALHNQQKQIVRRYKTRRWITCVLEYKNRHRTVMAPHRYTELFFLDEAVAFAAGHRPCAECQRERFSAFRHVWQLYQGLDRPPSTVEIDEALHTARIDGGQKVTHQAPLRSLPDGCFVERDGLSYLVIGGMLAKWTPAGYTTRQNLSGNPTLIVLTPMPVVAGFRLGYKPQIHPSSTDVSELSGQVYD
jgi:hypothetical protein